MENSSLATVSALAAQMCGGEKSLRGGELRADGRRDGLGFFLEGMGAMWCKACQQDVRAMMLPTERNSAPHCPRCGEGLRNATLRLEAIAEMAEAEGDFQVLRRNLQATVISGGVSGGSGERGGESITIGSSRRATRTEVSTDWRWDEDRRKLRRIHAGLEGGAMFRFDPSHAAVAVAAPATQPSPAVAPERKPAGGSMANGLLFIGLTALSAGTALLAHRLWSGAANSLVMPLVVGGQVLVTFGLLLRIESMRGRE